MRYRRPFTPDQRREAIKAYRSYRKHWTVLRREFPPMDREQRQLLRQYRQAIHDLAAQLRKSDRFVDTLALNRADGWARWWPMEYWRVWHLGRHDHG
ncbi:MAG: hypothetical protein ACREJC_04690 [Tepidisphaeraceae bacterium]